MTPGRPVIAKVTSGCGSARPLWAAVRDTQIPLRAHASVRLLLLPSLYFGEKQTRRS